MKKLFMVIMSLSLSIFSLDTLAYDTCNPANPFVPCTYSSVDFDSYIGNDNQGAVFFIYSAMTGLTEFPEYYYVNVSNGSSLINFGYSSGWIDYGFYNGGMAYKSPFYGITGFQMLGGVAPPIETPHFRYPIDYTSEIPNNWSHRIQSYGSLNNTGSVPHAAEDWNKTTGGCTDAGEPLYSIADGTVIDITLGSGIDGWGKTILIQHDAPEGKHFLTGTGQALTTIYSLYAHMLKAGQYYDEYLQDIYDSTMDIQQVENGSIEIGDPVGQVGDGDGYYLNACHLHFAILTNASLVSTYRNQDPYDWDAMNNFIDPSELINNGLYSDQSIVFSIIVHPYEFSETFQLNDTAPSSDGSSNTIGNWTRRKGEQAPGTPELGYSGIIYSKPASDTGTASWTPNLPRDGQYRVWVYIPNSATYASSEEAEYVITSNNISSSPQSVNQSTHNGSWVDIGTYDLYQGDTTVSLNGDTNEIGKVIAVDAVKFEYVGSIQ